MKERRPVTAAQSQPASASARVPAATDAVVDRIYQSGFLVRPVSREDAALVVSVGGGGASISATQWQLLKASREQIAELDLRRSRITDNDAAAIAELSNVTRLHLEGTGLTDSGVRNLAVLQRLEYLNLFGNRGITDASLDAIAGIVSLKRVYLWDTGITEAGLTQLQTRRPDLKIDTGAAPRGSR